jgi:hypothetical protein
MHKWKRYQLQEWISDTEIYLDLKDLKINLLTEEVESCLKSRTRRGATHECSLSDTSQLSLLHHFNT